jgi:hypothetical protein
MTGTTAAAGSVGGGLMASAERTCGQLNARLKASEPPRGATARQVASNALAHAALEHQTLAELQALAVPSALAARWRQMLSYRRTLVSELLTLAHAWTVGDQQMIVALAGSKERVHQQMYRLARAAGFNACARVGPAT